MKNKNYPLYEVEHLSNLKELVDSAAEKYGDKPAFTFERKKEIVSISFNQFKSDVDALGTEFHFRDMKNQKIAIQNNYIGILQ